MTWAPEDYLIAIFEGTEKVSGYSYRGLGLHMLRAPSGNGRRPAVWSLSHLGTGHQICTLKGNVATAFPIAAEIAECGDWTFDGLHGWRNVDPEIPAKFRTIMAAHSRAISRVDGPGRSNEATARAVLMSRA